MFCAQLRCSPRGNRHHKIQFYSPSAGTRGRSAHSLTAPCYRPSPPTYAAGLISVMFAAFLPITFKASGTVVRPPTSVKPLPGRLIAEEPPVNGSTKCAYASESSETVPATPLSWAALPPPDLRRPKYQRSAPKNAAGDLPRSVIFAITQSTAEDLTWGYCIGRSS
jgi:hypothetical protein